MDDDFGDDADFSAAVAAVEKSHQSAAPGIPAPHKIQQPTPQVLPSRSGPSAILVSPRQKGNPILTSIRSLPWEYGDIPSDYVLGATTCALFLSLKYHRLHPEYIYSRIRALGGKYNLRILLTMVDIQNHEESLKELSKTSLINNLTLILTWSASEAGRYLELFKSYEHASPTSIRAHQTTSYAEKLVEFITVPRSINKTDAVGLVSAFGSVRAAVNARPEEIGSITGWGEKKVQRWCGTVREPFRVRKAAKRGLEGREGTLGEGETARRLPNQQNPTEQSMNQTLSNDPDFQPTNPSKIPAQTPPARPPKRAAEQEIPPWHAPSDDEEEESLLLAAAVADAEAEAEASQSRQANNDPPLPEARKKVVDRAEGGMTDGMIAALARLREK